ncbi:MAG: PEP-CTERM sorting domain-containing protein [Fuerstiella sp.]
MSGKIAGCDKRGVTWKTFQATYTDVSTLTGLTDFAVDVDVNDLDDGGIWLRSDYNGGSLNGVLLVTGGNGGTYDGLYWHVVTNGSVAAATGFAAQTGLQGADVHIRVEVIGNTYSAFLNGSAMAFTTLTDSTFSSGSVGLYDYSPTSGAGSPRGQTFDNFQVEDLTTAVPEPSGLALFGLGAFGMIGYRRRQRRRDNV